MLRHKRTESSLDTDLVDLVYIPHCMPQDTTMSNRGAGSDQGVLQDAGQEVVSDVSLGERSATEDLSGDAEDSESDNVGADKPGHPQRSTRGQLPVRYREGYVME